MSTTLLAGDLDSEAVLGGLQGWLDGTRDLEAGFVQTLVSGALGTGLEETGTIYLLRPGRMRWDYHEPEKKVVVIEGEETRLYLEEDRQLWKGKLDDAGILLRLLLSSARPVDELFDASLSATPKQGGEGSYRIKLVPRTEGEEFRHVVLTLRPPTFGIEEAEVLDGAGNRMLFRFRRPKRNRDLSPAVFRFDPPPGTEIVVQP